MHRMIVIQHTALHKETIIIHGYVLLVDKHVKEPRRTYLWNFSKHRSVEDRA